MSEFAGTIPELKRQMLRHTVATLAYRGAKTVSNAPEDFGAFRVTETARTPAEILAHIGDLLEWALLMAKGQQAWRDSQPLPWADEVRRFFGALNEFDSYLASDAPLEFSAEKLFQGPIADALSHVGQIALLRRVAGAPIRGENYFKAEIVSGRVGEQQSAPRVEFD